MNRLWQVETATMSYGYYYLFKNKWKWAIACVLLTKFITQWAEDYKNVREYSQKLRNH